jgi:uncharacterized membrane protein
MPDQPQPKLRRELLGAYVLAVFSIPGILFSLFLTILKFRNEFTCESVLLTTCAGGCSVALNDELSVILGIPLTVYATSFFVVALVVGSIILLSARIGPLMRLLSLLLGWSGLSISLALGVYARLGLGEFCELCAVLYCACTGIFLGAWLINPQGPLQGFRDKARGTVSEAGTIILVAATAFAALTGVQYNRYRTEVLESRKASLLTCQERVSRALPPPYSRATQHTSQKSFLDSLSTCPARTAVTSSQTGSNSGMSTATSWISKCSIFRWIRCAEAGIARVRPEILRASARLLSSA